MERVMVVKKEILERHGFIDETGLNTDSAYKEKLFGVLRNECEYIPREQAENDACYKQIIPYVVVRYQDSFLLLRRLRQQSESRLHDKLSIGVGGHITDIDGRCLGDAVKNGMYRELSEEIRVNYTHPPEFIGFLNDTSNDVSRVHLGVVYILLADSADIEVLEKEKMEGRWMSVDRLEEVSENLEMWSQILLRQFLAFYIN